MYQPFIPRPVTDRSYWDEIANAPAHAPLRQHLQNLIAAAPARPPVLCASDYIAARRHNNRAIVDNFWERHRVILAALAFNRCLRGIEENDPDDRLLDWLWSFLNEPTWSVAAHLPGMDLPSTAEPRLDLAATEMAANLAEMCQSLRPWMDSVSGTLYGSILHEIDRRVLTPYATHEDSAWWQAPGRVVSNWLGVCAGSILATCESMAAQGQPRPEARQRAIAGVRRFLDEAFTPAGECDEGMSYWVYGVGVACIGLSRLRRDELAEAVDLERLRIVADYPRRAHLFGDMFYSGNDSQLQVSSAMYFVPWLAGVTDNPWLRKWAATTTLLKRASSEWRHFGAWQRYIDGRAGSPTANPSLSIDATAGSSNESSAITSRLLTDQQVAIVEGPHPSGRMLAVLGGGHNGERHNHNDLGHFMLAVGEQWIIPDLGAVHYTSDFFGPKRYEYLPASSRGHCCPLINGHDQRSGREAAAKVLLWHPDSMPVFSLDLTAAYPVETMLDRWWRTMAFSGTMPGHSRLRIHDEIHTSRPSLPVVHVIWSLVEPQVLSSESIRLGPVTCTLRSSSLGSFAIAEEDPKALLLRHFTEVPLYRIEWTTSTDGRGQLSLASEFA